MRRRVALGGLIAAVVAAASAQAASTRAEYIAQADPICQSTMAAERQAIGPKGNIQRLVKRGRFKAAGSRLRDEMLAFSSGVEQIALLVPPAEDAQLIGSWVQNLRAQVPLGLRAARALKDGRIATKVFIRLDVADRDARAAVATYGFQHCWDL